jgi:hypothetical protein
MLSLASTLPFVALSALAATDLSSSVIPTLPSGLGGPSPPQCHVLEDTDINPHTAGLGHVAGTSIDQCCQVCRSPEWYEKGCRFSTFSRGSCWLKANNATVVHSPGKSSVGVSGEAPPPPPPPPLPPPPPKGTTGSWESIGPWNIGDDIYINGEAGTLADASSPVDNPHIIYTGGQNNGASSGILKSVDYGRHWTLASNGMYITRIHGVYVVDRKGDHVLATTTGGIYESFDGAASWTLVNVSVGRCWQIKNATIGGVEHVLVGCDLGLANFPRDAPPSAGVDKWKIIGNQPGMAGTFFTVSDVGPNGNSVIGACVGVVTLGQILNRTHGIWWQPTYAPWSNSTMPCTDVCINPTDATNLMWTKPPLTYASWDNVTTVVNLNHSNIWHCGIDRQGWMYTAAEGGAFVSFDPQQRPIQWQAYYDIRVERRINVTRNRVPHDYQRIVTDFAGGAGVAFPSDQGLFLKPPQPGNRSLVLYSANGNMSNNIALKVAVSKGDGPGRNFLVTTAWDWGPLASWDSGAHWPSWQTPDDGAGAGCIGEGGGAYAMGASNHMTVMHHHNIMYSSRGGKNLTRFVVPHGATVFGPNGYPRVPGSRTEPSGGLFVGVFFGPMPFDQFGDVAYSNCTTTLVEPTAGMTQHTNFSCLAAVDLGVQYGWYKGVNAAVFRGDQDRRCYACTLPGNSSGWPYTKASGAWSYALQTAGELEAKKFIKRYDREGDGRIDGRDLSEDCKLHKGEEEEDRPKYNQSNGIQYIGKNYAYGSGNWTWSELPDWLVAHGTVGFINDPTDKSILYATAGQCITTSKDDGDTWGPCWELPYSLTDFHDLTIRDSSTMIITRGSHVPVRTRDGGKTWQNMTSLAGLVAQGVLGGHASFTYSWTGKTLVLHGTGGAQSVDHPHAGWIWVSKDDGDTWTDETADIVTMAVGAGQFYEGKFYLNTAGQGILAKTFE